MHGYPSNMGSVRLIMADARLPGKWKVYVESGDITHPIDSLKHRQAQYVNKNVQKNVKIVALYYCIWNLT